MDGVHFIVCRSIHDIRFLQLGILGLQWDVRHTCQQPPCRSELMLTWQPEQAVQASTV